MLLPKHADGFLYSWSSILQKFNLREHIFKNKKRFLMTGSAGNEQCIYWKTQEISRKEWDIEVISMQIGGPHKKKEQYKFLKVYKQI